jgi:hypothetical protein
MDTMETIEVASGLSTEVKMLVAVCVVLATMLVLTMVSFPSQPREQPEPRTRHNARTYGAARTHAAIDAVDAHHIIYIARARVTVT